MYDVSTVPLVVLTCIVLGNFTVTLILNTQHAHLALSLLSKHTLTNP